MVLAQPVQGARQQEVAHLVAPEVEDERPPVGVLAAPRVLVLVERGAVEAPQRPVVLGEVRRDPVEDDADARLVQAVDQEAEVVGRAPARGGREVAGDLVAPGAGERVGHDRQQLDVGEPHVGRVGGEVVSELAEAQLAVGLARVTAPRAEVDLVDRHRLDLRVAQPPAVDPRVVAPRVRRPVDHRGGLGRRLGLEGDRVGLQADVAVLRVDLELVAGALDHAGQEELPDPRRAERAHRVQAPVPRVEVAHDADRPRGGRPHREGRPRHAVDLPDVRAQAAVEVLVAALARQVQVHLAQRRHKRVRVGERVGVAGRVGDLELVAHRQLRVLDDALEQAVAVDLLELHARGLHDDALGVGAVGADDHPALGRVGAEVAVGIGGVHAMGSSSSRRMPATGMRTQSGRLLSS